MKTITTEDHAQPNPTSWFMLLFWLALLLLNCWLAATVTNKPLLNPATAGIFVSLCGVSSACRPFVRKSSQRKILAVVGLVFALGGFIVAITFLIRQQG
jgi:hypothetical protein